MKPQRRTTQRPRAERRLATIGGASITFEVREFAFIGEQGMARIWGAFGPAVASNGPDVRGKSVGVRYRWERGQREMEEARLFDSDGAARGFAMARVRPMKAAVV